MPSTGGDDKQPVSPWVYVGWTSCGCLVFAALGAAVAWYLITRYVAAVLPVGGY